MKSGSFFCNQNDQQLSGESAKVHSDRPTVDDYNTQHDTSSGCGVQHNGEVDQDSISVHAGDDDMTVSSRSEAETDLEARQLNLFIYLCCLLLIEGICQQSLS